MIRRLATIAFIIWTVGMAYLLLIPGSEIPKVRIFEHQDKVAHLILFSGWCFLLILTLKKSSNQSSFVVFVIGLFMAGITEWLQAYIPYRTPDIADFALDSVGIAAGVVLGFFVKKELFSA